MWMWSKLCTAMRSPNLETMPLTSYLLRVRKTLRCILDKRQLWSKPNVLYNLINPIADKYFFLLRETSAWRTRWDFFIILTAFYIIFLNPYDVAFMVRSKHVYGWFRLTRFRSSGMLIWSSTGPTLWTSWWISGRPTMMTMDRKSPPGGWSPGTT